jgi:hypothetical protein
LSCMILPTATIMIPWIWVFWSDVASTPLKNLSIDEVTADWIAFAGPEELLEPALDDAALDDPAGAEAAGDAGFAS